MCYTEAHVQEPINENIAARDPIRGDWDLLIGYTLGDALKAAADNGYGIADILITAPPKLEIPEVDHSFRVLRVQNVEDKKLSLLVCKPL